MLQLARFFLDFVERLIFFLKNVRRRRKKHISIYGFVQEAPVSAFVVRQNFWEVCILVTWTVIYYTQKTRISYNVCSINILKKCSISMASFEVARSTMMKCCEKSDWTKNNGGWESFIRQTSEKNEPDYFRHNSDNTKPTSIFPSFPESWVIWLWNVYS